jgi:hypothetical protein
VRGIALPDAFHEVRSVIQREIAMFPYWIMFLKPFSVRGLVAVAIIE